MSEHTIGSSREAHRPAVPVHRQRRQHQGDGAELQHRARAVGDVADLLGEADDLDLEIRVLELRADALFQQVVVGHVVQLRVVGAHLQQLGGDHGARLVARDQRTHESPCEAARRMPAMDSGVSCPGVMVLSISGSARKPSSVISLTKLLGVQTERTPSRSTLGR